MKPTIAAFSLLAALLSGPTSAATIGGALVKQVLVTEFDRAFIYFVGPAPTATAACATLTRTYPYRFVVDLSTPSGRAILNQANLAMALGKQVDVYGRSTFPEFNPAATAAPAPSCNLWADTETLRMLNFVN
jgi:hypothetical protein